MEHEKKAAVARCGDGGHRDKEAPMKSPVHTKQALKAMEGVVRADRKPSASAVVSIAASSSNQKRSMETDSKYSDDPYGLNHLTGYETEVSTKKPN